MEKIKCLRPRAAVRAPHARLAATDLRARARTRAQEQMQRFKRALTVGDSSIRVHIMDLPIGMELVLNPIPKS